MVPEWLPWVSGALVVGYVGLRYLFPQDTNFYLHGNPVAVS